MNPMPTTPPDGFAIPENEGNTRMTLWSILIIILIILLILALFSALR